MVRAKERLIAFALVAVMLITQVLPVAAAPGSLPVGASSIGTSGQQGSEETNTLGESGSGEVTVSYPDNLVRIPADAQPNSSLRQARAATGSISISDVPLGNYVNIQIGAYKYPFVVVAKNNYNVNGVTLMSAQTLATVTTSHYSNSPYLNTEYKYEDSQQRVYLTDEFYQTIASDIKALMLRPSMYALHADNVSGSKTYAPISDYVFIPAVNEIADASYYGSDSQAPTKWNISGTANKNKMIPLDATWNVFDDMSNEITTRDASTDYAGVSGTVEYPYRQGAYFTSSGNWDYKKISYYTSGNSFPFDISAPLVPCIYLSPDARVSSSTNSYTSTDGKNYDAHDFIFNSPPTTPGAVTVPNQVKQWESNNIPVSWTASTDPDGDPITYTLERSINGGGFTQVTTTTNTSYTDTVTAAMTSNVRYRVKASDGSEESGYSSSGTCTILWDNTAPTINITASPSNDWTSGTVVLTVTVSDTESGLATLQAPTELAGGTGTINLDGTTAEKTFTVSENGSYAFAVTDKAGNRNQATAEVKNIDTDGPTITHVLNPAGYTKDNVNIELTVIDGGSGLKSFISPSEEIPMSGKSAAYTYTATDNGIFSFSAVDALGNSSDHTAEVTNIDRTAPTLEVTASASVYTNAGSVTLSAAANDDKSGVASITLPDGMVTPAATATYTITENGEYTFLAVDNVGNETELVFEFQLFDRTAPKLHAITFDETGSPLVAAMARAFTGDPAIYNQQVRATPTFSDIPDGTESESGVMYFTYRIYAKDGTPLTNWETINAVYGVSPLLQYEMDGYIDAYVMDAAGNKSATERFEILLDGTDPVISYTVSTTDFTRYPVKVTLTGEDDNSGFQKFVVMETGEDFSTDALDYLFESNGTFTFRGYDNAGNYDEKAITVSNIDLTPPQIDSLVFEPASLNFAGRTIWFNESVRMVVQASDTPNGIDAESGVATFSYRIFDDDDNPLSPWRHIPIDQVNDIPPISTVMSGYVLAYVTDNVGHKSYDNNDLYLGEKFPLVIDDTKPTLSYTLDADTFINRPVTATIVGKDDRSGFHKFVLTDTGEEVPGDKMEYVFEDNGSITVRGYDRAGNYDEITVLVDLIDMVPPTIEIRGNEEERADSSQPITFVIDVQDDYSGVAGITLPDNSYVSGSYATFTARTNGTYTFTAHDVAGNIAFSDSIVVSSITGGEGGGEGGSPGGSGGSSGGGGNKGTGSGNTDIVFFDPDATLEEEIQENGNGGNGESTSGNVNEVPMTGIIGLYPYWVSEEQLLNRLQALLAGLVQVASTTVV